jgi:hypothetical protein
MANPLDGLFGGLRRLLLGGVEKPFASALNIIAPGATIEEGVDGDGNPTTELDLSGLSAGGSSFPLSANVSAGGFKITSHAAPSAGGDVANKTYVDAAAAAAVATADAAADAGDAAVLATIPAAGGAPADVTKAAASSGAASSYSRSDHKHDVGTAAPGAVTLSGVTAAEGSSANLARADHAHSITGRLPGANLPATIEPLAAGGTAGQSPRINAGATAWEVYTPPSLTLGADLGDASVTVDISQGAVRFMRAATTTAARNIDISCTTGSPEEGDTWQGWIYAQGHNVTVRSVGGSSTLTIGVVAAGTARLVQANFDGVNWARDGRGRI